MAKCTCDSTSYDWEKPGAVCPANDPKGVYVCTRPKGHKGDHATCFKAECKASTWPNTSDAQITKVQE
jgi:hypothetical protein